MLDRDTRGVSETIEALMKNGADLDTSCCRYWDGISISKDGIPFEHLWKPISRSNGNTKVTKTLLASGSNFGGPEMRAKALQWEMNTCSASFKMVNLLVDEGCNLLIKGPLGKTAIQQALALRHSPIIRYFLGMVSDEEAAIAIGDAKLSMLQWARTEPWYPRLAEMIKHAEQGVRVAPINYIMSDATAALSLLTQSFRLPQQVALKILDFAEYWIKSSVAPDDYICVDQDDELCLTYYSKFVWTGSPRDGPAERRAELRAGHRSQHDFSYDFYCSRIWAIYMSPKPRVLQRLHHRLIRQLIHHLI